METYEIVNDYINDLEREESDAVMGDRISQQDSFDGSDLCLVKGLVEVFAEAT